MLILVHVVRGDPKQEVEDSRHLKALDDFGEFDDFAPDGQQSFFRIGFLMFDKLYVQFYDGNC